MALWFVVTNQSAKDRAVAIAERQAGRIAYHQMHAAGLAHSTIHVWSRDGVLHPELPHVYAFAPVMRSQPGRLWGAILYAGPGAGLTGVNGAWWHGLLIHSDPNIVVSTPRRRESLPGVEVHARRPEGRELVRGLPVAPLPQLMLDLAATGRVTLVRRALACLDYQERLDAAALLEACGPGRAGSPTLRWAIEHYDPRFARTNGPLEDDFLIVICEAYGVPKPDEVGAWIHEIECDAVYRQARVIVQLDGRRNHGSEAKRLVDHANDLTLRQQGWTVLRYSWGLVHTRAAEVASEILSALRCA